MHNRIKRVGEFVHKKRTLTANEKQVFLDLTEDDITKSLLTDFFADRYDAIRGETIQSRFNTYDEFTLNKGDYPTITKPILTNCGLFIVNKFLFEREWVDVIGYANTPMNKKQLGALDDKLTSMIMDDTTGELRDKYVRYLNKLTWLQLTFHTEICTSISIKSSKPNKVVQKKKKELLAKHADSIKNGDAAVASKIQEELIAIARDEMKDDPTFDLYESGARGSFDNAYRQEMLIKGPIYNAANGKYEIMTNSLNEGADKENLSAFANAVVSGLYPKAVGTRVSGYDTKKMNAGLQSEVLDDAGTDCHSKYPISVKLTEEKASAYKYNYIVEGSKYVRLDDSTKSKYIGKTVKLRLPSTCAGKKICACCAGDRYYLLGIKEVGLTVGKLTNDLLQGGMKQSHDTTVRTYEINPDTDFVPYK